MKNVVRLFGLFIFLAAGLFSEPQMKIALAQNKETLQKENQIIEKRAKEIEAFLTEEPSVFGAPWSDRSAWEQIAKLPEKNEVVKRAEKLLKTPIKENPEDLYKEFYKNGNRTRYQNAVGQWNSRLIFLALAEGIEHKGRFIPALEEIIKKYCEYPSWVLPAHDTNGSIYDGKVVYSDLVSTALAQTLGIILSWAGNDLSPEIIAAAKENIEKRVLEPYRICVKNGTRAGKRNMWWIRGTNNWNSVCHAGTIGAALTTIPSKSERAWFIAAAEYYTIHYFFAGFTADGYCSEGMGYWNYGFGNFVYLGSAVRQATSGKVDLFKIPLVVKCTNFGPGMEIAGKKYAAFADCSITAQPSVVYLNYLSRSCGLNLNYYEFAGNPYQSKYNFFELVYFLFDPFISSDSKSKIQEVKTGNAPIRTDFDVAGVLICRPKPDNKKRTLAVAMKGGNNNEMHNHNDIGSYSLTLVDYDKNGDQTAEFMVLDPGGEIYTQRTFSKDRYVGQLLNSFGHPVPMINGHLQKSGSAAKGVVLEKFLSDDLDVFSLDMTSAYAQPEIKSVIRTFSYYRTNSKKLPETANQKENVSGALVIEDKIALDPSAIKQTAKMNKRISDRSANGQKQSVSAENDRPSVGKTADSQTSDLSGKNVIKTDRIFESALITYQKTTAKKIDGSWLVQIAGKNKIQVLVSLFDAKGNKAAISCEKQIVGKEDDSVRRKPTRLAFGPENSLDEGTIRFVFLP